MNTKIFHFRLLALFIISITVIAYELAVMRTFAVGSWSNFGSMVISIAMLGIGLAGTLFTFFNKRIQQNTDAWLRLSALLLGPAMALSHVAAQYVPFNPVMMSVDWTQITWIGAYYIIYAVPFFIGAVFIGVFFIGFQEYIYKVYFWNMFGSGLGGFIILGLMYVLPPERLIEPLVILTVLASLLCFVQFNDKSDRLLLPLGPSFIAAIIMIASIGLVAMAGDIKVSEFKPVSYARQFPDSTMVYHSYGPQGEFYVYQSSYFHFAPGLSDNASLNVKSMPENAFIGLYIDGQGPIGIMRKLKVDEEAYIDYLPMSAPYLLLNKPNVLLLQLGGGIGVSNALYHKARSISVAEPDPALIHMLKDVLFFRQYTGDILRDPQVHIYNVEPRAFTDSTKKRFDLVEIGLIDSVGLSQTGGYPLDENYTYTAEGINSYLHTLNPNGMLSITVWNRLDPPRNVPKLLTTVIKALEMRGVNEPGKHIFVFDSLLSTATILVKNSEFTKADLQTLLQFLRKTSFEPCYYPGMQSPGKDFNAILKAYTDQFKAQPTTPAEAELGNAAIAGANIPAELIPEDMYYYTVDWLLHGKADELYGKYFFNISPATDNRPYYTGYVKPPTVLMVLNNIKNLSEEWGYVLAFFTLVVSIIFGMFIIFIPLAGRWRELFKRQKGTVRVILYYAALGAGYMMVEIYLMQRLVFFLANQTFSNATVITAMLVISGIGALAADRYKGGRRRLIGYAALGISAAMIFYLIILPGILDALIGWPLLIKILLAIIFIAPSAFFLGMPFPTGLASLSKNRNGLIPWAWGINGALSVSGAILARLVSISWGFSSVLIFVIILYWISYFTFSGNQIKAATS
ncbi:MAG: spermidine synthase family protein [Candidatus Humimicrobiaceae bacterium]